MHVIYQLKGETMTIYFCGDQKFVCIVSLSVISMYFQVVVFVMCVCIVDYFLFDCVIILFLWCFKRRFDVVNHCHTVMIMMILLGLHVVFYVINTIMVSLVATFY